MFILPGSIRHPSRAQELLQPGIVKARHRLSDSWKGSLGHILVQDKLVDGTAFIRSVFPHTPSLLWLFSSLQVLHLPVFERVMHLSVISATCAAVVSSNMEPLLEVGMSPPLLASVYQAGADLASKLLFLWEADVSIGHAWSSPSLSRGFRCNTLVRL